MTLQLGSRLGAYKILARSVVDRGFEWLERAYQQQDVGLAVRAACASAPSTAMRAGARS